MRPPYQQPGANVAFWSVFGLFAVGEYTMRLRRGLHKSGTRVEGWSLGVVIVSVAVGVVAGLQLARWRGGSIDVLRWPLFVVGLGLMAVGVFGRQWAIRTLGRFFTVDVRVHSDQTVVDPGPYRWVRHPSYTGLISLFRRRRRRAGQLGFAARARVASDSRAPRAHPLRGARAAGGARRRLPPLRGSTPPAFPRHLVAARTLS